MFFCREYDIQYDAEELIWQVAAEKVERRTPYVKEWGDGISIANTIEDTERIWQQVKQREKEKLLLKLEEKAASAAASNSNNVAAVAEAAAKTDNNKSNNDGSSSSKMLVVPSSKYRIPNNGKKKLSSFSFVPQRFREHGTIVGTATLAFTLGMFVSRFMLKRGL